MTTAPGTAPGTAAAPAPASRPVSGWSRSQRIHALRAAVAAGWNDRQRYMAMRHAGCPDDRAINRPTISNPRNSQDAFEAFMAIAEASALSIGNGAKMPRPARGGLWRDAAAQRADRTRRLIESIAREASERMPIIFKPGFLPGFIERQTKNDPPEFTLGGLPRTARDLDEGQAYRVLEGLRAWVGRQFVRADIVPHSFTIPPHVRRALAAAARSPE